MYIPYYDEFLIYTTKEEIISFIEETISDGIERTENEILEISRSKFGDEFGDIIKFIISEV